MNDARGQRSHTLMFVALSWSAVMAKYLVAGVNLGPLGIQPTMTALEFGGAVGMILGIWLGREWRAKGLENESRS